MTLKSTYSRTLLGLVASAMLGMTGATGAAPIQGPALDNGQIKDLIVGNTARGVALAKLFNIYYEANGKVSAIFQGGKLSESDNGTWTIKNGNTVCHDFSHLFGGVERCYQWHKADGQRYVMRNVDTYKVDDLTVWNVNPGNPVGF